MYGIVCLIIATILYLVICLQNLYNKDYPHTIVWAGYVFANFGFLWWQIQQFYSNK